MVCDLKGLVEHVDRTQRPVMVRHHVTRDRKEPRSKGVRLTGFDSAQRTGENHAGRICRVLGRVEAVQAESIDIVHIATIEMLERGQRVLGCGDELVVTCLLPDLHATDRQSHGVAFRAHSNS